MNIDLQIAHGIFYAYVCILAMNSVQLPYVTWYPIIIYNFFVYFRILLRYICLTAFSVRIRGPYFQIVSIYCQLQHIMAFGC